MGLLDAEYERSDEDQELLDWLYRRKAEVDLSRANFLSGLSGQNNFLRHSCRRCYSECWCLRFGCKSPLESGWDRGYCYCGRQYSYTPVYRQQAQSRYLHTGCYG